MTKKLQVANALIGFVVFVMIYAAGLLAFWQFFPYETARVEVPIEIQNVNDIIEPGGVIELLIVIEKTSNYRATVNRIVLCGETNHGQEHIYGVTRIDDSERVPQGTFIARRKFKLADDIPDGSVCIFKFINEYQVNPIRTITKEWASEPFEIKE